MPQFPHPKLRPDPMIEVLPTAKSATSTVEADVRPAAPVARKGLRSLSDSGRCPELDDRQVSRALEVGDDQLELGATARAKRRGGLLAVRCGIPRSRLEARATARRQAVLVDLERSAATEALVRSEFGIPAQ